MVPSFVKKVAESNDSCGFASEIHRQPRGAAAEEAGYRVQFFSTVLQNRAGQSKIDGAENSNRREKSPILRIPKPMLCGRFGQGNGYNRRTCQCASIAGGGIARNRVRYAGVKWAIIKVR